MATATATAAASASDSAINTDLQELHDSLIERVGELASAIGDAPDSDTVDAIVREISEVNHRVTLVGNLLFTQQTKKISDQMQKVRDATADVQMAIEEVDDITRFVKGVTAFLALVDKVIDTAKVVLP
jgi:uncharacterized protein YydD (DUF2326 family)